MALGFHDVRFPTDVSFGASGGPEYKTHVFSSYRGFEKRNIEWSQPLMKFNAAYGIKRDEQMQDVIAFFTARQGKAYGFRYRNWINYQLVGEPIATGDGFSTRLPLWKFYGFQGARSYKRLRKIVPGTVSGVGVGAVGTLVEGVDFNIDYNEGEIALNDAPGYGTPIYGSLEFDEAVRFDIDNINVVIDAYNNNSLTTLPLVSIRAPFTEGSVFAPDIQNTSADAFLDKTWLILNFDDITDLATTVDQSILAVPVTLEGNATLTTSQLAHGSGSLSLGTTGRVVITGGPYDFSPGQPFTIECFAQQPTSGEEDQLIIGKWDETTNDRCWALRYKRSTSELQFVISPDGTSETVITTSPWTTGALGDFDYLTIDRLVNGWYVLRINGEVVSNRRETSAVNNANIQVAVGHILNPAAGQGPFQGLVDSVRITQGQARHQTFTSVTVPGPYTTAS